MISIIGAGPAGSHLAYLLAKKGHEVNVYEDHKSIGNPVQCTGLVTDSINQIMKVPEKVIVNKITGFKVFSRNNSVEINFKKPNIVLDRMKFDRHVAEKAEDAGAKYFLNHRFETCKINKENVEFMANNKIFNTDYLIGADGPFSQVAKSANIYNKRKFMIGIQARVTLPVENPELIEVYIGEGYFGWLVPEDKNIARIGTASYKNSNFFFKSLMTKRAPNVKIREYQSGVIPMFDPKQKLQNGRVFLIGDAACHTKNPSHGGIIQGLIASQFLTKAITENKNYKRLLRPLRRELRYNLFIRKVLDKLSENDLDKLVYLVKKTNVKNILETYDRDYPSQLIFKLLINEPRLISFVKYII
ncbi:MAG: NAD(P)/FAD-dependent oxidoreductase [Nanoarchaeota archaeon]